MRPKTSVIAVAALPSVDARLEMPTANLIIQAKSPMEKDVKNENELDPVGNADSDTVGSFSL